MNTFSNLQLAYHQHLSHIENKIYQNYHNSKPNSTEKIKKGEKNENHPSNLSADTLTLKSFNKSLNNKRPKNDDTFILSAMNTVDISSILTSKTKSYASGKYPFDELTGSTYNRILGSVEGATELGSASRMRRLVE